MYLLLLGLQSMTPPLFPDWHLGHLVKTTSGWPHRRGLYKASTASAGSSSGIPSGSEAYTSWTWCLSLNGLKWLAAHWSTPSIGYPLLGIMHFPQHLQASIYIGYISPDLGLNSTFDTS
ncbi:hypothetical protein ACLKA6_001937 [Drosophila palustris]